MGIPVVVECPDFYLLASSSATGSAVPITAGKYNWAVYGTWNGASAQLQWSPNGGTTWIDIDGATASSDGGWTGIPLGNGVVRVSFNGTPTSISSKLSGVR